VGIRVGFDFVILQAADRAVDFQDGQSYIAALGNTVLAHCALQFVHTDVLFLQVGLDRFPIVDEKARFALDYVPKGAAGARKRANQIIQQEKRRRGDHTPNQRRVGPGHGILHGIGKEKQQREIEGRHLPHFALATKPHADQDDEVDHRGAQSNLQHDLPARRE